MSTSKQKLRKCNFYLNPANNEGDKIACDLLEQTPTKERGKIMRAMLVSGAALMVQDKRLPSLLADFVTEKTTISDIKRLFCSVLPSFFIDEVKNNNVLNKKTSQEINKTRENSDKLFPDD
ncbi:plasmid partitioning/stability family protein (plasmid) [Arsenophonus sp. aPb]|uniref:plasmid partitioning/stability family protein n=1 Tax=Arsenophonus sp. aPb TaxID=3041619 RepID=UPI002469AB39|nr:plasmid partitioning/stability family protein [Arsenophonus sp. aPb]WGL99962.1 plasmid partitioning/stability family protein [Arsenophonus sp. aPb]